MAIIAIAREIGAFGEELADELVRTTGLSILDRQDIEDKLVGYGLAPGKLQKFDEKKPGLWASLSQERDDYLHFLKLVIYEEAAQGGCVIMGRGAGAILKNLPNLASIRVTAPLAIRTERIKAQFKCDEKRALQLIEHSDHERAGFHKYFFSVDWEDAREYGLVLNTGMLSVDEAVDLADHYRNLASTKEREEAGSLRVAELLLGHRVVTEICYAKKIAIHFLEAEARGSRISLHGVANAQTSIDLAVAAARNVAGVTEVESAIQIVQEFTVMP
jgi:cytidylate kinase